MVFKVLFFLFNKIEPKVYKSFHLIRSMIGVDEEANPNATIMDKEIEQKPTKEDYPTKTYVTQQNKHHLPPSPHGVYNTNRLIKNWIKLSIP